MQLKSLSYIEWEGKPQEWTIRDLLLGKRNLLVGKNSSGKSRSLSIIYVLARHLMGQQPPGLSGNFHCVFDNEGSEYIYELKVENEAVTWERVQIDGKEMMMRGVGGVGKIFAQQLNDQMVFQTPQNSFAAFAKQDLLQHPFLALLGTWANALRFYPFAGNLGKDHLTIFIPNGVAVDDREQHAVVGLFNDGKKRFGARFINALLADLEALDYPAEYVDVGPPVSVRINTAGGPVPSCLHVKEKGLNGVTDQLSMSNGMYRVLALLIHVNYGALKSSASTVLIDDIGEGLDFDRSLKLIQLLREKANASNLQLIMATNDKFVMNSVPLEEWTVLHRHGQHVKVRNHENSRAYFDDFKYTGLSNFSFFEINSTELATGDDDYRFGSDNHEGKDA
ncbi:MULTISPECIES: hypothetical protein [Paraburkholderia]|uniref:hypothetical protein n=1 Tax=Paraburkholderia TaxID=1822464 RepID=UPI00321827E0